MTYEEWGTFSNTIVVAVLAGTLTLMMMTYFGTLHPVGEDGKRRGRLGLTALVGGMVFVTLGFAYNLIVIEPYPEHADRSQQERAEGQSLSLVEGRWRPNNGARSDYFVFTRHTWSSVNPDQDTTITWDYEVLRRDGACMRIRSTSTRVVEAGHITHDGPSQDDGDPMTVCVDPDTDMMVMRFDGGGADVFLVRMN